MRKSVQFLELENGKVLQVTTEARILEEMKMGWCTPEGKTISYMLSKFPNTDMVRVFFGPNSRLGKWTDSPLKAIPDDLDAFISFKYWDENDIKNSMLTALEREGVSWYSYHHEPEQGTNAGDPPKSVWFDRWERLVVLASNIDPAHKKIKLAPTFTNYYQLRNDWREWYPYGANHGIDAVAFDVYNKDLGSLRYNSPTTLLAEVIEMSKELDKPYILSEIGTERIASDTDGHKASEWMSDMYGYAYDTGCIGFLWFYYGGNDFEKLGRALEDGTLQALMS